MSVDHANTGILVAIYVQKTFLKALASTTIARIEKLKTGTCKSQLPGMV